MHVPTLTRLVLVLLLSGLALGATAQTKIPEGKPGEVAYIAYPVNITLDGKTDDWAGIPVTTVTKGPSVSKDPAENGSFRFSLAANQDTLFLLMTSVDKVLITGQHGADFWNEDSLEFYLNVGQTFGIQKYTKDVVQYRILPSDIGNADPAMFNLTGTNLGTAPLKAKVFRTADGWGFEGAVKLPATVKPAHGGEIGFQAQANGAAVKDRNVKLIWSNLDKSDNSWQNPSLFGRGIFYEIGRTDLPVASEATSQVASAPAPVVRRSEVALNQVGFFPNGVKTATLAKAGSAPLEWWIRDAKTQIAAARGMTSAGKEDQVSGQVLHTADFSDFTAEGQFLIEIDGKASSPFRIEANLVSGLAKQSLAYFYRNRSGIELKAEFAGSAWARPAGHLSDASVPAYQTKGLKVNGLKGWYDAGDFGKYVVNGGIAVWTLQNAFERSPSSFPDGAQAIPENKNGVSDLLDEARWEMEFLLNMQIPAGQPKAGMAFHKLHDLQWSGVPTNLPTQETRERYAYQPTTAATLNLAAVAAQASRLWKPLDKAFSDRCLDVAQKAWKAAQANPNVLAGSVPGSGGGDYGDNNVSDEFFWAAAELFATTGAQEYQKALASGNTGSGSMSWGDTGALGTLTLLTAKNTLPAGDLERLRSQAIAAADRFRTIQKAEGYRVPMDASGYVWGSSSVVLNNAIFLAVAYDLTKNGDYRDGVVQALDYLLGHNALNKSFVSGFGADTLSHPHHRVWGNDPDAGYPAPPPGAIAGGPNASIQDPVMTSENLADRPISQRYLDNIGSYATNEVAINWNAPLVWVASWLDQQYGVR